MAINSLKREIAIIQKAITPQQNKDFDADLLKILLLGNEILINIGRGLDVTELIEQQHREREIFGKKYPIVTVYNSTQTGLEVLDHMQKFTLKS